MTGFGQSHDVIRDDDLEIGDLFDFVPRIGNGKDVTLSD